MIAPVRALTRLVAVPRIPAPGANPKPRLGKIILPSAAPAEAAPEALSDAVPDAGRMNEISFKIGEILRDVIHDIMGLDKVDKVEEEKESE